MEAIFSIIIILASILLVIVVFVQNPKGGGLSSDFGAAAQMGGVQRTNDFIEKATWYLAGTIMTLSIVLTVLNTPDVKTIDSAAQQQESNNQGQGNGGNTPPPAPVTK